MQIVVVFVMPDALMPRARSVNRKAPTPKWDMQSPDPKVGYEKP
jgi:hypothetical protein